MIEKVSNKFTYEADGRKIAFTIDKNGKVSIYNTFDNSNEFVFKNSKQKTIESLAIAFCEISNFAKSYNETLQDSVYQKIVCK